MNNKTIQSWKKEYGRVFRQTIEGKEVYYRTLTAGETIELIGKDEPQLTNIIPDLVILNDVELKLVGSRVNLAKRVATESVIPDQDILKGKAIKNREKVTNGFFLSLISELCKIYPYTPDQLMDKTLDQLLTITAMAENSSGNHIILTGDEKKQGKIPTARPMVRNDTKFNPAPLDEMMNDSAEALAAEMRKYGKEAPKFKKEIKSDKPLTELQKQMRELNANLL